MTAPFTLAADPSPAADARALDILLRARQAFVDKGFDGASMQDLARAAGMSVGNFYRYFPSKAAIVEALVLADMAEMEQDFGRIIDSDDPMGNLRLMTRQRVTGEDCLDDGLLWAEITAAALRKPEIAAITDRMEGRIIGYLCTVMARAHGIAAADAERVFATRARFLVALVKAAGMMRRDDPGTAAVHDMFLQTIDSTLSAAAPIPTDF